MLVKTVWKWLLEIINMISWQRGEYEQITLAETSANDENVVCNCVSHDS